MTEELNMLSLDDMMENAIKERFMLLDSYEVGSEEREKYFRELMDMVKVLEERKRLDSDDLAVSVKALDAKAERKQERKDAIIRAILDIVAGSLGTFGTWALANRMYRFNEAGNFMTADQSKAVGMLNNHIGKI